MRIAIPMALAASLLLAYPATADMTKCKLVYDLKGWSFFYSTYKGTGTVRCRNGQSAKVGLRLHAGGATAGKSEINGGKGWFSEVKDISEVFGTYVSLEGHAGATRSGEGRAMTKGEVSLSLSGTGRGFDLGVAIGGFTISRL
jgi:hypothetical protein